VSLPPSLDQTPAAAAATFSNVTVQVFSLVPSSSGYADVNLTGSNASSNPYIDELFQGTPNPTGGLVGNLSTGFYSIERAWLADMSTMTQTVSLQLYATMSVTSGNSTQQYTAFNNLPYNPRETPTVFSAQVSFSTAPTFSGPTQSFSLEPTAMVPAELPPPTCDVGYYWDPVNSTYISDGDVPLAIGNATDAPSGAGLSYAISYSNSALQLSFTSATEWANASAYSGLQMSEAPSWSGDDTSFSGATEAGYSLSGGTPTMIGLGGAELTVQNYREWRVYGTPTDCEQEALNLYSTTVSLDGFDNGSSFEFVSPSLPGYFGNLLSNMRDWTPLTTSQLIYGGASVSFYSVITTAEGYSNAQDAEMQAESAFSALTFAIGATLLVCDVLDLIPGFAAPDGVAEAMAVIADVTGVAASMLDLFSTISFSTSEHTSVEQFAVEVGNGGAHDNLNATFYEASATERLSIGSSSYSPNMPLIYVDAT